MTGCRWPVANNHLSQILPIPCVPMITSSPMASPDPQLQELGVSAVKNSNEFLNETSAVGFYQSFPEKMSNQEGRTIPAMEIIEITDDDKDSPYYKLIGSDNINVSRSKFGPSRPVSLPPMGEGGRKGTLAHQEKKQVREARKQGICIICRKIKAKVDQE